MVEIVLHEPTVALHESQYDSEIVPTKSIVINLDANANAPTTTAVQESVLGAMRSGAANPSSGHALGEQARTILAQARDDVAELVDGAIEDGVVFTAGCTEANNTVLRSIGRERRTVFITTQVEHSSVLRPAEALRQEGVDLITLKVNRNGIVDLESLKHHIECIAGDILLSVQAANSETGVLQPIAEIASIVARRTNVLFHSDIAQAYGKMHLRLGRPHGPDVVTLSGHKIHAPMGIGAVILAEGEDRLRPLILGGGQECGRRSGTQSVPLIAGLGVAAADRRNNFISEVAKMARLRDRLESGVIALLPNLIINGQGAPRLPNTSNIQFPGVDAMAMLANLDAAGVMCSQGSACNSGRPEPSHVLTAMGLTESEAFSSIRFSVSPLNTDQEIDCAAELISKVARNIQA